jgi:hypothetical protein
LLVGEILSTVIIGLGKTAAARGEYFWKSHLFNPLR